MSIGRNCARAINIAMNTPVYVLSDSITKYGVEIAYTSVIY
jgi:hypothetical protein